MGGYVVLATVCDVVCAWWSSAGHPGSPGVLGHWRGEVLFPVRSLGRCSGSAGVLFDVWCAGPALFVMSGYVLGVARSCKGSCVLPWFLPSMCF